MVEQAELSVGLDPYLAATAIVDYTDPTVEALAKELACGKTAITEVINRCFTFVRDEITHSSDAGASVVTCSASEVLRERTGIC